MLSRPTIEILPMTSVDRAAAITRGMNEELTARNVLFSRVITGLAAVGCAVFFAVGAMLPVRDAGTFQLVEIHGTESDIVDFNLSSSDCGAYLMDAKAQGRALVCESTN